MAIKFLNSFIISTKECVIKYLYLYDETHILKNYFEGDYSVRIDTRAYSK
jgi:hypothetical protein